MTNPATSLPRRRLVLVFLAALATAAMVVGALLGGAERVVQEQLGLSIAALAVLGGLAYLAFRPVLAAIAQEAADLDATARRYGLLFESVRDHLLQLDEAGRVLLANPATSTLLGVDAGRLAGRPLVDFVHGDDRSAVVGYLENAFGAEERAALTFRVLGARGERWLEATARAYDDGGALRTVVVARDLEARKRAEHERSLVQRQLAQHERLDSLAVLAAGVARDFNELLLGVLGNAELARSDLPGDSLARARLLDIEAGTRRAAKLTSQLLAYAGKAQLDFETFDLNQTLAALGPLLVGSLPENAELELSLAAERLEVTGDVRQLGQVVRDLVTNAAEALEAGGGRLVLRTGLRDVERAFVAEAVLGEELDAGFYVVLEVEDTGEGMQPSRIRRIFDPFYSTRVAGRGLGLAAALGVVKAHGGAVHVASEVGRGTTVSVLLPSAAGVLRPAPPPGAPSTSTHTVLVVDDEPAVQRLVERMLAKIDCGVLLASDGVEALEVLREHQGRIDAVLLDYAMPRIDGVETHAALRRIAPGMPVVVMSGYPKGETAQLFPKDDLVAVLNKPFEFQELVGTLRSALRGGAHVTRA
jgi:PAS domain S-box-containing protein